MESKKSAEPGENAPRLNSPSWLWSCASDKAKLHCSLNASDMNLSLFIPLLPHMSTMKRFAEGFYRDSACRHILFYSIAWCSAERQTLLFPSAHPAGTTSAFLHQKIRLIINDTEGKAKLMSSLSRLVSTISRLLSFPNIAVTTTSIKANNLSTNNTFPLISLISNLLRIFRMMTIAVNQHCNCLVQYPPRSKLQLGYQLKPNQMEANVTM